MMTFEQLKRTVITSEDRVPDWSSIPEPERLEVTKIVVGKLATASNDKEEDSELACSALPADFASQFPKLTHLYLWSLSELSTLPKLPDSLKWLDVRGCAQLEELSLPNSLEALDVGNCSSIQRLNGAVPIRLARLYINGCKALDKRRLGLFLESLRESEQDLLIEFDASDCPAIESIEDLPRSIKKLVLKACQNLRTLDDVGEFRELCHLNIAQCPSLASLPDLPPKVQYLEMQGSDNLRSFMNQNVGKVDRENETNVARSFHTRKKFGSELSCAAFAKLLFLGDGRVGKSTLAKRLQWSELSAEQRKILANAHLEPSDDEKSTHKMRFWNWNTRLQLTGDQATDLNMRAEAANLPTPCDLEHRIDGSVRLWDFGGQEIYHQTHRLFASAGSVFLIVWRDEEIDEQTLLNAMPANTCTREEWLAWNGRRSLDYWLEYVESINPDAKVALVCTCCPQGKNRPGWELRAPRRAAKGTLPCFYVDSLDEKDCQTNPQFRELVNWIRDSCGAEAVSNGILQPAYFGSVARYVDELLQENQQRRERKEKADHLLTDWPVWQSTLMTRHQESGDSALSLAVDDTLTITNYLHGCGHLFYLKDSATQAVLIDQDWATDLIYSMFSPLSSLAERIKNSDGVFDSHWLTADPHWQTLHNDFERQQILRYMQECGIIVPLVSREDSRSGAELLLATEKWLLPPYETLERKLQATIEVARIAGHDYEAFSFEDTTINAFDFRKLMVHLANVLGMRGVWFRDGMQATNDLLNPQWCFRVRWIPSAEAPDGFFGHVDAVLVAPQEVLPQLIAEIEEVFHDENSPLHHTRPKLIPRERQELDLSALFFRGDRDADYDVAVSSRGADKHIVEAIVASLKAAGLRTKWYLEPNCRQGDHKDVLPFMHSLRRPPCIVIYLSDQFLEDDPDSNWYCPWELADAMIRIAEGKRTVDRTLVLYKPGDTLTSNNLDDEAKRIFTKLGQHFAAKYAQNWQHPDTFEYYNRWAAHFSRALNPDALGTFFRRRGTHGSYSEVIVGDDGSVDCRALIQEIRTALGTGNPGNQA